MRKTLSISLTLFLLSCDREENVSQNDSGKFIGVWKESKSFVISGKNSSIIFSSIPNSCESKSTFEFTSDKKYISNYYNDNSGSCKFDEKVVVDYSYDSNLKKINIGGYTGDVLLLTNTKIQIVEGLYDEDNDGIEDKMIFEITK